MNGGENKKPRSFGYTIVEVMIFLAVSGFMFVISAVFISGKQAAVEFHQGLNDTNTQLRTVMNDVTNGLYISDSGFTCKVPNYKTSATATPQITGGSTDQGANGGNPNNNSNLGGCIFMGKVMQFNAGGATQYKTYPIAGRQQNMKDNVVTTFSEAQPVVIPSLVATQTIADGLNAPTMWLCTTADCAGHSRIYGMGFFGSFGSYSSTGTGNLNSGAQSLTVVTFPMAITSPNTIHCGLIGGCGTASPLASNNYVKICLTDGGSKRGSITVGADGQQTATRIQYGASTPC